MTITIRRAEQGDLGTVLALYQHFGMSDPAASPDLAARTFATIIASPSLHIFLLEQDGIARASCYLNIIDNLTRQARPYGVIENVVTHSDHRKKGFAKAVLQHALEAAWAAGCYKVMLLTGVPELVGFYEKCGFDGTAKKALLARNPAM